MLNVFIHFPANILGDLVIEQPGTEYHPVYRHVSPWMHYFTLAKVSVKSNDQLGVAFQVCINQNTRAVIVTGTQNRVVGQITLRDLITLGEDQLRTLRVRDANITSAIRVNSGSSGSDLIKIFREFDPPVVAVVDDSDNFIGTILERETMKHMSNLLSENADSPVVERHENISKKMQKNF